MKKTIERPCAMPIIVEVLDNGKYVVKLTVSGENEYLTVEELQELFKALCQSLDEIDKKIDRKEKRRVDTERSA